MALHIHNAHTGQRLDVDPISITSMDSLRSWTTNTTNIPLQSQVFLTSKGAPVKLQSLLAEKEIFVYDLSVMTATTPNSPTPHPSSKLLSTIQNQRLPKLTITPPPEQTTADPDLRDWQTLFRARRDWAHTLASACRPVATHVTRLTAETAVIERGVQLATSAPSRHLPSIQARYGVACDWFDEASGEQAEMAQRWEADVERLSQIPARAEFAPFIAMPHTVEPSTHRRRPSMGATGRRRSSAATTLDAFVDRQAVAGSVEASRSACQIFVTRLEELGGIIDKIAGDYEDLAGLGLKAKPSADSGLEPERLFQEIQAVVNQISSDGEAISRLQAGSKTAISQASKLALEHTRNYLPALMDLAREMEDLGRQTLEKKNLAATNSIDQLQTISLIQQMLSNVSKELEILQISSEGQKAFEALAFVSRLPIGYGALLVESVRRKEWTDKIKKDSSVLQEEIAGYQEEEERRRKKWLKNLQDILKSEAIQVAPIGVEISLLGEERLWPSITRDDLQSHLNVLQGIEGMGDAVTAMKDAIKELDRPTKQQVKHAQAFKMGSVHEAAAYGKPSLSLRGDEEIQNLKQSNSKLEDELKSQRSRVRKLEDLLHRSASINRTSAASGFNPNHSPDFSPDLNVPLPSPDFADTNSRRSSMSSRRFSSNRPNDEKILTRRVLALEDELAAEKESRMRLERLTASKGVAARDAQKLIDEANSTKRDLMENMEAQQREFSTERRSLEDEVSKLKQRIEETEDEVDRMLGSRDNERTGADVKLRAVLAELDLVRKEADDEVVILKRQAKEQEIALKRRRKTGEEHQDTLGGIFSLLSPESETPAEPTALVEAIEGLVHQSIDHIKNLEQNLAMATSDNKALQTALNSSFKETTRETEKFEAEERQVAKIKDQLAAESARSASLASELDEERSHLKAIRNKFAEGETGSETLRQRVADEEAKVLKLSTELAKAKSHVNSLDVELSALQKKHESLQAASDADGSRLKQQSARAKDLSRRIYTQNERLVRLLEVLGFAVSRNEGRMVVQRAPKHGAGVGSGYLNDTATSGLRLMSSASTTPPLDLSVLYWPDKESSSEEDAKYMEYLKLIDQFHVGAFSEAISKRARDLEHTARKWQKEARAYRDRAHRSQSDAQDKIAFRNFREGDLALFLPTRNQATRPWAAFNVGAPHYFLRETDAHMLRNKDWLVARISHIDERVVGKAKINSGGTVTNAVPDSAQEREPEHNDNPFDLSEGLRWYMLDAVEEKAGAPSTPGLGKSTVASAMVDARGTTVSASASRPRRGIGINIMGGNSKEDASNTLNRSLGSRRSSEGSRRSFITAVTSSSPPTAKLSSTAPGATIPQAAVAQNAASSTPVGAGAVTTGNASRPDSREAKADADADAGDEETPQGVRIDANAIPRPTQTPSPSKPTMKRGDSSRTASPIKRLQSPSKQRSAAAAAAAASNAPSANASPAKQSGTAGTPSPQKLKAGGSLWDSMWQLDISLERGSNTATSSANATSGGAAAASASASGSKAKK